LSALTSCNGIQIAIKQSNKIIESINIISSQIIIASATHFTLQRSKTFSLVIFLSLPPRPSFPPNERENELLRYLLLLALKAGWKKCTMQSYSGKVSTTFLCSMCFLLLLHDLHADR
jgi:hypothetical protein